MSAPKTRSARRPIKWRDKEWNCVFAWTDSKGVDRVARGRKFVIDGTEVELYPSGALCAVLERNRKCLYKWEANFNFPQALFRVRDAKTINRWYSKKQLIALYTIAKGFDWLRGKNRSKLPAFIEAVRKVFFTVDQPIKQRNPE